MAKGGQQGRAAQSSRGGARELSPRDPQAFTRLAVLIAVLLIAVYTAFAIWRLESTPRLPVTAAAAILQGRSEAVAARLDLQTASARAGLATAADLLRRAPEAPRDAAESGVAISAGALRGIAVVAQDQLLAVAGPQGADPGLER